MRLVEVVAGPLVEGWAAGVRGVELVLVRTTRRAERGAGGDGADGARERPGALGPAAAATAWAAESAVGTPPTNPQCQYYYSRHIAREVLTKAAPSTITIVMTVCTAAVEKTLCRNTLRPNSG
jgi:hypothetical protein